MATSSTVTPTVSRVALRLRLADAPGHDRLDGGWWPQSGDLPVELADLVDHFPAERGRIVRAVYSARDWGTVTRRVRVARGYVETASFPGDGTGEIQLWMADRTVLNVLVAPPGLSPGQAEEALLAAATQGNRHSGRSLLDTVTELPEVDPADHWVDEGGPWRRSVS